MLAVVDQCRILKLCTVVMLVQLLCEAARLPSESHVLDAEAVSASSWENSIAAEERFASNRVIGDHHRANEQVSLSLCQPAAASQSSGCRRDCRCKVLERCYPKWLHDEQSGNRTTQRIDIGVCELSLVVMTSASAFLIVSLILSVAVLRQCLESAESCQ
mmetsp:Transcript_56930/g.133744  ORF Transcript_56930/g.133744 Transcript_56930/m.133744 type:complete len:160 (-) Transcript_56930:42-521(-)